MPNDMIAIKASQLPAHLRNRGKKVENVFAAAVSSGGFPVVSIKGKAFHVQRGDERTLVTKPGEEDAAGSLEVVILSANPNKSKVFYDQGYEEGSSAKPTCYSNSGISPAADAEDPQAKKCAVCPHNEWGSRITDNGSKGKRCADSMRLAIAPAGQLNDPMLLRVPAATLKTLGAYGAQLAKRGVGPSDVITKIGFDYNVAHPSLTFKAVRFVDEDEAAEIEQVLLDEAETISNITGVSGSGMDENEARSDAAPTPVKAAKPAPAPAVEDDEDEDEVPVKAAPAKTKVVEFDDIDAALDNLDFDD